MSIDVNAVVGELQEQLKILSSRAAQMAGQLAAVTKELDEFREKLNEREEDTT